MRLFRILNSLELVEDETAMVDGGLYDFAPKPDIVIAVHSGTYYPTVSLGTPSGRRLAGTDQLYNIIHGFGDTGLRPTARKIR